MLDKESIILNYNRIRKKSRNKFYNKKKYNVIYIIILVILLIYIIILKIKIKKFQNQNPNNQLSNDITQSLQMCYYSRSLFFINSRAKIMNNKNINDKSMLITIQEKLNYLLIHESPDYKSKIADKIKLHEYSIKMLGKDICVPIIKIYENTNDIKLEELPDKFVLKCNHGSGMNIICPNKSNFNLLSARNNLDNWKKIDYGLKNGEFQYININRKIFAENFLKENIEDYKVYCFHGKPKFIRVQKKYDNTNKINNYYDLNWNLTELETGLPHFIRDDKIIFPKPKNLDIMLDYAIKLSSEFVFVRVDFYNIDGQIYLGEMTFAPSNLLFNLKNREQSVYLGNLIDLNKIKDYLFN